MSEKRYKSLAKRDGGWHCYYCKATLCNPDDPKSIGMRATVDHVIPRSQGGSNTIDNLVLSCRICNGLKGAMSMEEWLATGHRTPKTRRKMFVGKAKPKPSVAPIPPTGTPRREFFYWRSE